MSRAGSNARQREFAKLFMSFSGKYPRHNVENGELIPSSSVRTESMERCELYEEGNWETRWQKK